MNVRGLEGRFEEKLCFQRKLGPAAWLCGALWTALAPVVQKNGRLYPVDKSISDQYIIQFQRSSPLFDLWENHFVLFWPRETPGNTILSIEKTSNFHRTYYIRKPKRSLNFSRV